MALVEALVVAGARTEEEGSKAGPGVGGPPSRRWPLEVVRIAARFFQKDLMEPARLSRLLHSLKQARRDSPLLGYLQRLESKGTAPRSMLGGLLQHVPLLGGTIWHSNNWQMRGTWLYRASSSTWQNLEPNADTGDFSSQAPTREQLAYLDTRRQVLVAQHEADTYELDLESLTWRMVLSKPPGAEAWPQGHDASAVMYFHPVSGHGLLLDYRSNRLWAYDPVGPAWRMLEPRGPGMPQGQRRLAYVDEALGIFVVIDDREVWAYRYDG